MYARVTEKGLSEIHEILAQYHKLGGDHFTPDMLHAWAEKVEYQANEGNTPSFEIRAHDCVRGHVMEFSLSDDAIEWPED